MLTIVISTRDPDRALVLARMYKDDGIACPAIIADRQESAWRLPKRIVAWCGGNQYRHLGPDPNDYDCLVTVLPAVASPFVLIASDAQFALPHAVPGLLAQLSIDASTVAAFGHVLGFDRHGQDIDINRVVAAAASNTGDDPLDRHLHVMRAGGPFLWALFRRDALAKAAAAAARVRDRLFQTMTFMNVLALQGKIARLPVICHLASDRPNAASEPSAFALFLRDSRSFVRRYGRYRNRLERFICEHRIMALDRARIRQLLDMTHMIWAKAQFETGDLNYAVRYQLGDDIPPVSNGGPLPAPPSQGTAQPEDVRHFDGRLLHIWRDHVLKARQQGVLLIRPEEVAVLEREIARTVCE